MLLLARTTPRDQVAKRTDGLSVLLIDMRDADPAALTRILADAGHYVSELTPMLADLESVFLDLTRDAP